MSRFYGSIQGNRGEATRMGTAKSGFGGHLRGWNIGASVNLLPVIKDGKDTGKDRLSVGITGGSQHGADYGNLAISIKEGEGVARVELRPYNVERCALNKIVFCFGGKESVIWEKPEAKQEVKEGA